MPVTYGVGNAVKCLPCSKSAEVLYRDKPISANDNKDGILGSKLKPSPLIATKGTAWILPDSSSRAGYLEFSGQGLQALEKAMEEKRSFMASLGAQLLQTQKQGVESADSVRLRQNAEASTLISTVKTVETAITEALQVMAEWEGISGDVTIKLNTDFIDTKINAQDMTTLMGAWQSGAISQDTFLWNMKRGEILPPEVSVEDEKGLIDLQVGELE